MNNGNLKDFTKKVTWLGLVLFFAFLSLKEHSGYDGKWIRTCVCIENNKCYLVAHT